MSVNTFSSISSFIETLLNQPEEYSGKTTVAPVISIISSFYNAHEYFEETYYSVMNQTLQNFEWIMVDDCSTDKNSISLFNSLESRSNKIKTYYHKVNKGLAAGRNTAISKANGKYLFFMDLDDLLDPTYLEKSVVFLELHPEISFVNSYCVGFGEQEYWWTHGFEKSTQFIEENFVTAMLTYRKQDFDMIGGFDEGFRFYEDWERWLKALAVGQKGWTIPEFLHCYRRMTSGLLLSSQQKVAYQKRLIRKLKKRYTKIFSEKSVLPPVVTESPTPYDVDNYRRNLQIENQLDNDLKKGQRILFLYPHLEIGGADKYNLDLLGILQKKGYQLTIATTLKANHAWQEHFYKITQDIYYLSNYGDETSWLSIISYLIESRKVDVFFISNSYFAYYLLPLLRTKYKNVAFIDNTHIYDMGWRVDGYPRLSRQFNEFFDAQIVSSEHLAHYNEQKEPITKGKFDICTTNIEPENWRFSESLRKKIRQFYNISDSTTLLLFPARLVIQKRPLFFVKIIKELVECELPVKAIIIGDGYLLESTRKLITELHLETHIFLIPPVNSKELRAYYCASDIFLFPTGYEGISIAVFEAMTIGLPIVASDVGGQRELVVTGTGYLIKKSDENENEIDEYCNALMPLILDTGLRKEIGTAARQRIEDFFTLENMGKNVEDVIRKARNERESNHQQVVSQLIGEELLTVAIECMRIEKDLINLHHNLHQTGVAYEQKILECEELKMQRNLLLSQIEGSKQADNAIYEKNIKEEIGVSSFIQLHYQELIKEIDLLKHQKKSMEASRFWKIRQQWFRLKYKIGLSKYES